MRARSLPSRNSSFWNVYCRYSCWTTSFKHVWWSPWLECLWLWWLARHFQSKTRCSTWIGCGSGFWSGTLQLAPADMDDVGRHSQRLIAEYDITILLCLIDQSIDDALDCLNGSKWFSVLDFQRGHYQIAMRGQDKDKLVFPNSKGCPKVFLTFQLLFSNLQRQQLVICIFFHSLPIWTMLLFLAKCQKSTRPVCLKSLIFFGKFAPNWQFSHLGI